ncbi:protein cortex isoform X2 [Topomyia yanbarensis]|uniref:protein cortex isoform X2 n=1 Tax=Topomyia yanbarensis TaxID=2498891 RepID=UPI00273C02F3|nr:protein cortex isoform X2 [Topomyia yanbarensis]
MENTMEFRIKKRDNCRINEVKKILKPVKFVPNRYGDRFIPRRYAQTRSSRFKAERKADRDTDLMRMERKGYWKSHAFAAIFNDMFNLSPDTDKILDFRDATNQLICRKLKIRNPIETYLEPTYTNVQKLDWSCKPRSKPLSFIESVHDLPRIKVEYTNIIDWSAKGQIAAIFSKKLVIWTPNTEETIAYCALRTTSIAFNPMGDILAMATFTQSRPILRLLSCFHPNIKANVSNMKMFSYLDSEISCLTWDCTGQYIACGLGNGQIIIIRSSDFEHMNRDTVGETHSARIVVLKFSHASKYLASSDESGHLYIWSWRNYQLCPLTVWISSKEVALFDWHPWREEEIIIADTEPVTIALLHVPSHKVLSYYRRRNVDCFITALAFNKVSGELVVSFSYPAGISPDMIVLASMDRVVDVMENHEDVVAHLFWSPDGKQLASAGYDEALTIWNFFGTSPTNKKNNSQSLSSGQQRNRNKEPMGGFDYSFLYKPIR